MYNAVVPSSRASSDASQLQSKPVDQQQRYFFPKATATFLQSRRSLDQPEDLVRPTTVEPIFDIDTANLPLKTWSANTVAEVYPPRLDDHAPAVVPEEPTCKADPYLHPVLARNERLRLTSLWYYTRGILSDPSLLARLQSKARLAQDFIGWEFAIIGILDNSSYTRLAAVNLPLAMLPRRESTCSHTINQDPGLIFFLPDMSKDWRFQNSPHVDIGGLRAYAGVPLSLETEYGEEVALGSLCVASNTPQHHLSRMQQIMLAHIADSLVADIVHSAKANRQQERRTLVDRLSELESHPQASDESMLGMILDAVKLTYPDASVSLQTSEASCILPMGRETLPFASFQSGLWEDCQYLEEWVEMSNHHGLIAPMTVRMVAAQYHGPHTPSFVVVASSDLRLIFDDVDAWFVKACADLASRSWHIRRLREAIQIRETFLRGITHKLRTPIHGILGSAELLSEELLSRTTSPIPNSLSLSVSQDASRTGSQLHLDAIRASGQDLISTVNSLITLSNWAGVTANDRSDALHTIDEIEAALADELWRLVATDSRYHTLVFLRRQLLASCDTIELDLATLKSCLLPIIVNAVQHTPNGVVQILLSAHAGPHGVSFDIIDNGCGMSTTLSQSLASSIEHSFELPTAHTGLGLVIAAKLAQSMNGHVTLVSSRVGKGSHFRLSLDQVVRSCSHPKTQPIQPALQQLPHSFHCPADSIVSASAIGQLSEMLVELGFAHSVAPETPLIVVTDEECTASIHNYDSNIVLRLKTNASQSSQSPITAGNVVHLASPVTTSAIVHALEQADALYQDIRAARTQADDVAARKDSHSCNCGHKATADMSHGAHDTNDHHVASQLLTMATKGKELHLTSTEQEVAASDKPVALLVDDNIINLRFLEMYCKRRGISYSSAVDGQKAVDKYTQNRANNAPPIQLIFMDLQMPVCDGVEATRQIRRLEQENKWQPSVILMVSGQDSPSDKKEALSAGANGYLIKPASVKVLDRHIEQFSPNTSHDAG